MRFSILSYAALQGLQAGTVIIADGGVPSGYQLLWNFVVIFAGNLPHEEVAPKELGDFDRDAGNAG
jgi:hypothetical protein